MLSSQQGQMLFETFQVAGSIADLPQTPGRNSASRRESISSREKDGFKGAPAFAVPQCRYVSHVDMLIWVHFHLQHAAVLHKVSRGPHLYHRVN